MVFLSDRLQVVCGLGPAGVAWAVEKLKCLLVTRNAGHDVQTLSCTSRASVETSSIGPGDEVNWEETSSQTGFHRGSDPSSSVQHHSDPEGIFALPLNPKPQILNHSAYVRFAKNLNPKPLTAPHPQRIPKPYTLIVAGEERAS